MSYKPEMLCQGEWCGNGMVFATEDEALKHGRELMSRWFVPTDCRAVESDETVNYRFDESAGRAVPMETPK